MKRAVLIFLSIIAIVLLLWGIDRAIAAGPFPTGVGGTGTGATPAPGQVLIGTASGTYTPAYVLCAGTCTVATSSGGITITGTGVATNTGNWAGTWQLYNPSDFLASSTQHVQTVNGMSGVVTITSSTLGVVWPTVNGTKAAAYAITGSNGVTATVSGATTTISVSLNGGNGVACSANQFLNTISATGTAQCASITFPTIPTYTFVAGSGLSISQATSTTNTTTTYTLVTSGNWTGTWQNATSGTYYPYSNPLGFVTSSNPLPTINGVQANAFMLIGDGSTVTSTTNGTTTVFKVIPGVYLTPASGTAMFYPLASNPSGYLTSSTAGLLYYPLSGNPSGFLSTTTGNWTGTWQGANSTTFYLASNPSGYITSSSLPRGTSGYFFFANASGTPTTVLSSLSEATNTDIAINAPSGTIPSNQLSIYSNANAGWANNAGNIPVLIYPTGTSIANSAELGFMVNQTGGLSGAIGTDSSGNGLSFGERDGAQVITEDRYGTILYSPNSSSGGRILELDNNYAGGSTIAFEQLGTSNISGGNPSGTWIGGIGTSFDWLNFQSSGGVSVFRVAPNGSLSVAGTSTTNGISNTGNVTTTNETVSSTLTLSHANASGTWNTLLSNDGNYTEINVTGSIPGTNPVPYNIVLQNCPSAATTSTAVTSSSWECAFSQAENLPDGSRNFVDWDTEYYPTGTNPFVASGWFDNANGTSSYLLPYVVHFGDNAAQNSALLMTPVSTQNAANVNTVFNLGTGEFTVGPKATSTGAFDITGAGASTCAGIYDAGASTIYGLTDSLPAPAGCTALGGYYHGLAIGGSSANAGSPIFGVLNSAQSSNGKGHTALTVYDTNEVDTFNNTLDDGNGNATVSSTLTTKNLKITSLSNTVLAVDGSGNVVATTTTGGGSSGVASTTPFTANAPVTVSSSGALSTYPNNPVPFYTYGVQYSQTTAAPGATSTISLWGPIYWNAAAQCSSLTYDIMTAGGTGSSLDIGIYDINGNLLADTGAQSASATGIKNASFTQGRKIITPQDVYVALGVTTTTIRMAAWAANYGWTQAGQGSNVANASGTLPSLTAIPASSTVNNTVVPSFSCSY